MENKFTKLVEIIEKLRSPQGCPWDKAQTPQSLVEHFEEEVGELKDAIKNQDTENFKEELGDVLLQVALQALQQVVQAHFQPELP